MLVKRIAGRHIAWFGQSNRWIGFEEPAWFVYKLFVKGVGAEGIIARCRKKYGSGDEESRKFVTGILEKLQEFQIPFESPAPLIPAVPNDPTISESVYSIHSYWINSKVLTISFETGWLEKSVHPLLAHLETTRPLAAGVLFELFQQENRYVIRVTNGEQMKIWVFELPELQKGRLFIEILNTIYDKAEDEWMTIVHGSAITDGKSTILFSSACGGGKSTIAALLQAHGLKVVSDDMVPVEAKTGKIYPFPAALSVKAGAILMLLPYYPELEQAQTFDFPTLNKQVRYLPLNQSLSDKKLINKAKALIFINFDPTADLLLEELSKLDAIKFFNDEAWVSSTPENARRYINWFTRLRCYKLTYSNNEKAVEAVRGIFLQKQEQEQEQGQ